MNRRLFLQQSSLLGATLAMDPSSLFAATSNIGVQLYTLRNEISKDPKGVLAQVAALGFKEVESFGYPGTQKYFGLSAADFAATLKLLGLSHPSAHYMLGSDKVPGSLNSGWEKAIEDAHTTGQKFMVLAYLLPNERKTLDDYKKVAEVVNRCAEQCKKAKIQFAYHNHDFEFQDLGGGNGMDILLKETDAREVQIELDLYWASFAGKDPVELFKQHPGRFPLWHVKDMDNTAKRSFTEVGNGTIDFKRIFSHAKTAGMKHFFVEQDQCPGPPLDSIKKSINYLQGSLLK